MVAGQQAEDVAADCQNRGDDAEHEGAALADKTEYAADDAEYCGDGEGDVQTQAHVKLIRYVGDVVVNRFAEALADHEALVKIEVRLAVAKRYEVSVFIVLLPVEVGAEALLGTGNGHLAVVAVDGLVFIADHGVLVDESHAGFKGLEVVLARGELSRALCELLCAGSELLLAVFKSLLSGLIILIALLVGSLALVIILIALSKRRLPFVIGLLTGCIVAQTLGIGADAFVICGLVFLE